MIETKATLSRDHTGRLRVTIECDGPEAYELAGQKSRKDDCVEVVVRMRPLAAIQRADRSSRAELIEDDAAD
jgi:hypothetical protein